MANNRRVFDLWFEIMRAELEELVHIPVTSRTATEIPPSASAYRSQLLLEGPVHGVMYVTASASSLVQLSQMVAGEPVDPKAAWTEEGLEVWQIWLTAASGKLALRLSEEIGDDAKNACTILLQGTTAVDGMDSSGGADTAASGAAIQELMLQAGEAEFALSVSAQVMFPGDDVAAASVEQPGMEKTTQEPVEAVPQADASAQAEVRDTALRKLRPHLDEVPRQQSRPKPRRASSLLRLPARLKRLLRKIPILIQNRAPSNDSTCCSISNWKPHCASVRWNCRSAKCWNWGPAMCCRWIGTFASQSN